MSWSSIRLALLDVCSELEEDAVLDIQFWRVIVWCMEPCLNSLTGAMPPSSLFLSSSLPLFLSSSLPLSLTLLPCPSQVARFLPPKRALALREQLSLDPAAGVASPPSRFTPRRLPTLRLHGALM